MGARRDTGKGAVMLHAWYHRRRWSREARAAVVFVIIEAALVLFVVGASLGWWGR